MTGQERFCEGCGQPLSPDMRFCEMCGLAVGPVPPSTNPPPVSPRPPSPPPPPHPQPSFYQDQILPSRGKTPWLIAGGAILIGILGLGIGYYFYQLILGTGLSARAERSYPLVKLETSMGDITLELYPDKAPATVANFIEYVKAGFYNGTIFHRVIKGFMIQGGGLDARMNKKPTRAPIKNEADNGLANDAYTIAMARASNPDSATAQFFISVANNTALNHTGKTARGWGYAVFGRVSQGREVVDKIKAVATTTRDSYENVPQEPVTIINATVVQK